MRIGAARSAPPLAGAPLGLLEGGQTGTAMLLGQAASWCHRLPNADSPNAHSPLPIPTRDSLAGSRKRQKR